MPIDKKIKEAADCRREKTPVVFDRGFLLQGRAGRGSLSRSSLGLSGRTPRPAGWGPLSFQVRRTEPLHSSSYITLSFQGAFVKEFFWKKIIDGRSSRLLSKMSLYYQALLESVAEWNQKIFFEKHRDDPRMISIKIDQVQRRTVTLDTTPAEKRHLMAVSRG